MGEIFDNLDMAWIKAMVHLKDERINAVEIHWGHGTITLQQATTGNPKCGGHRRVERSEWVCTECGLRKHIFSQE
jgi:hypothetical protein